MTSIYGPNALDLKKKKNQSGKTRPTGNPRTILHCYYNTYLAGRAMLSKWVGITDLRLPS